MIEVFRASDMGSEQRQRCVKWEDGPAELSTGLCPRQLGVADDDGRTVAAVDDQDDGQGRQRSMT